MPRPRLARALRRAFAALGRGRAQWLCCALIEEALRYSLSAETGVEFSFDGMRCRIRLSFKPSDVDEVVA
jgi:hypothetical protein